jgi:hypothetical protein
MQGPLLPFGVCDHSCYCYVLLLWSHDFAVDEDGDDYDGVAVVVIAG